MMELSLIKEIVLLCLFIVVLFCVFLPLKFAQNAQNSGVDLFHSQRYATIVSCMNCFAAGIFLATCLLHLFPDVRDNIDTAMAIIYPNQKFPFAEFMIAMGFFLLLTIEQIIADIREKNYRMEDSPSASGDTDESTPILYRNTPDVASAEYGSSSTSTVERPPSSVLNHEHNVAIRAIAMIIALAIHSIFEGIAIGVQTSMENVLQMTGGILIHKLVIALSLGLTLSQSSFSMFKSLLLGAIFAISSPIGIAIGLIVTNDESDSSLVIGCLQGLAAGTFLYVTFLEVLPHEFKSGHLHLSKLFFFILGFSIICVTIYFFPG